MLTWSLPQSLRGRKKFSHVPVQLFFCYSYSTLIIQHRVAYDYYNNFQNVVPTFLFPLILIEKNAIETLPLFSHPNLDRHSPIFRRPRYILCLLCFEFVQSSTQEKPHSTFKKSTLDNVPFLPGVDFFNIDCEFQCRNTF